MTILGELKTNTTSKVYLSGALPRISVQKKYTPILQGLRLLFPTEKSWDRKVELAEGIKAQQAILFGSLFVHNVLRLSFHSYPSPATPSRDTRSGAQSMEGPSPSNWLEIETTRQLRKEDTAKGFPPLLFLWEDTQQPRMGKSYPCLLAEPAESNGSSVGTW